MQLYRGLEPLEVASIIPLLCAGFPRNCSTAIQTRKQATISDKNLACYKSALARESLRLARNTTALEILILTPAETKPATVEKLGINLATQGIEGTSGGKWPT